MTKPKNRSPREEVEQRHSYMIKASKPESPELEDFEQHPAVLLERANAFIKDLESGIIDLGRQRSALRQENAALKARVEALEGGLTDLMGVALGIATSIGAPNADQKRVKLIAQALAGDPDAKGKWPDIDAIHDLLEPKSPDRAHMEE